MRVAYVVFSLSLAGCGDARLSDDDGVEDGDRSEGSDGVPDSDSSSGLEDARVIVYPNPADSRFLRVETGSWNVLFSGEKDEAGMALAFEEATVVHPGSTVSRHRFESASSYQSYVGGQWYGIDLAGDGTLSITARAKDHDGQEVVVVRSDVDVSNLGLGSGPGSSASSLTGLPTPVRPSQRSGTQSQPPALMGQTNAVDVTLDVCGDPSDNALVDVQVQLTNGQSHRFRGRFRSASQSFRVDLPNSPLSDPASVAESVCDSMSGAIDAACSELSSLLLPDTVDDLCGQLSDSTFDPSVFSDCPTALTGLSVACAGSVVLGSVPVNQRYPSVPRDVCGLVDDVVDSYVDPARIAQIRSLVIALDVLKEIEGPWTPVSPDVTWPHFRLEAEPLGGCEDDCKHVGDLADPVLGNVICIPSGTFTMGCLVGRDDVAGMCHWYETPARSVQLTRPFWMMESEVTQSQYAEVTGLSPSYFIGADLPVEGVSWTEAVAFADAVSVAQGLAPCGTDDPYECEGWRLPTEAEWEYAARGGEGFPFAGSDRPGLVAWYYNNWGKRFDRDYAHGLECGGDACTRPVCTKARNGFGLCDMSGNVWEWTSDWFAVYSRQETIDPVGPSSGSGRVYRGGAWYYDADVQRVAFRYGSISNDRDSSIGFRLVRSVP